jgi:hypothetical protein
MNGHEGAFRVHTRQQRVRVWLGSHCIVDHITAPDLADEYAEAMGRRYTSCRVTSEPLPELPIDPPPLAYTGQDGAR